MKHPLVLSLFPGIGLLDMAFEKEGFCVVRGPDIIWGGNIRRFNPPSGRFDGVIAGPPCQRYSSLQRINVARGMPLPECLIPEFERCVSEAQPGWFVMENVSAAPVPVVDGYAVTDQLLDNHWLDQEQGRLRRWSFGVSGSTPVRLEFDLPALHGTKRVPTVTRRATKWENRPGRRGRPRSTISWKHFRESVALQGLPEGFLEEFNPRPFTVEGAQAMVGNGVPLAMGRAVAQAVNRAATHEGRTQ